MSKNSESLNRSLYALLRSKGYKPKMLSTAGKPSPVPEDAAVFLFHFIKDGKDYGQVAASIDGAKKLIVYFDDEVADSPDTNTSGTNVSDSWSSLLQHLSQWRFSKGLRSFEAKNQDHLEPDMAQREYMNKKENVTEGYHAMGKQASYSDSVPNVKIVIQHSRKIEEGEQRYRNIARIFVENTNGERFLIPTTKPGIAQVYARHIAEGGTPYDDRAQHINSLVEEHSKMSGFVRATRNGQFNESTQRLVQEGINHYHSLRETLGKMRGHRGYSAYFESWTPSLMEDDSDTSNINELFVQETVDPRIESVMPILSKLQKNLSESPMKEVDQLAEWADSLLEGGDGGEASEESDGDTSDTAGEGGAEDSPKDDLAEGENDALNPVGIPESDDNEPFNYDEWKASKVKPRKPRGYKDAEAIGQQQKEIDRERKEKKEQGVAEDKGMTQYNAFKREWRSKHGADAKVPGYDSKEYTSYCWRQGDKKKDANENFINTDAQAVVAEGQEDFDAIMRIIRK